MPKIAIHTRTKSVLIEKVTELKEAGKAKTSWPRLLEESGLAVGALHSILSPVTELKGGWTVVDTKHLEKLEDALNVEPNTLVQIVSKGAKKPDLSEKTEVKLRPAPQAAEAKPAAKKAAAKKAAPKPKGDAA